MIPTVIGLPSGSDRKPYHNAIASWLSTFSIGVYYPQCAITSSYNLAQQWDAEKESLNWTYAALAWAQEFEQPMVGYYPQYFWRDRIVGKKSPNPNAFAFAGISQDKLQPAEMAYYLRAVRNWLQARGIAQPWYMIDEPAHPVDGDPYKYGWSATMEARVVKFVTALVDAGWTVGVCHPNYQAHTYWRDRLPAQRVILNAESRRADYGGITGEVWLYNKRGTFDGLADRMREFGAVGYLHWSATWDKLPLAKIDGTAWEPTAHMDELLRQIELYEQPPQPEPEGGVYQIFLTNAAEHFQSAKGLAAIPGWAKRAEVQIEFARTETDSDGDRYALAGAPGAWLGSEGVEVWYYVDPVAPVLLRDQRYPVAIGDHVSDPFWFRKMQANAILQNDWILKDKAGQPVVGKGRNRIVPDIGNLAYMDWLATAIAETGVRRVFFDNFGPHQHGYHRPQKAAGQDGSDSLSILGMRALCDRLRAAGIRIIANAAWEMSNPDMAADGWVFPLMDTVDGVMIELEYVPGKAPGSGFARWSDGKWWALTKDNMPAVIRRWREAGKTVVLSATYRDTGGAVGYETFARDWYDFALSNGCLFFTGRDDPPNKATHAVWPFAVPATEPDPEPGSDVAAILAEILAARLDIAAGQAVLERAKERLAVIEQLAVAL